MAAKRRRPKRCREEDEQVATSQMEQRTRWLPWVVAGLTLFVFLPAAGNDFVNWDDDRNFLENPYYRGLSLENIRWMFTTFHLGHYHPLTWLSLGLDYVLWEMNPAGYHFSNIVLHAATALLVYFLILRLLGLATQAEEKTAELRFSAAFGALLFAIHPLRVESVAWVSERRDVLAGFFYVAAALLYLRGRLAASVGVFAAALMSKIIVASLPVVLLLVDIYPLRIKPSFGLLLNKIPYFALALAAGLFALSQQRTGVGGTFADIAVEPALRVTMSLYELAFYLWKTVLPFGLAPQYVLGSSPGAFDIPLLVGSFAAIAITAAAGFVWRKWPGAAVGWGCYVVILLPVLSILRYDPQQFVSDHHSYLAALGLAVPAAGLFLKFFSRDRAPVVAGCAAVVTLFYCERTIAQIDIWQNSETLWAHTLTVSPLSVVAHNNRGRILAEQGETDRALGHFRRAVEIKPDYAHARYNLGNLLMQQGELARAEQHFRRALEREPRYAAALNSLGNCLVRQKREPESEEYYLRAIEAEARFADAHSNLALALHQQGKLDQAAGHYESATRLDPSNADAHSNWGVLLEAKGQVEDAIGHYRRALAIEPTHADARRNLHAAQSEQPLQ